MNKEFGEKKVPESFIKKEKFTNTAFGSKHQPEPFSHKEGFMFAVDLGIDTALQIIQENFENPRSGNPEEELRYHSTRHTRGVIQRTEKILIAIRDANPGSGLVTERDIQLGKLAAAFHDTEQKWKIEQVLDDEGQPMRKRERYIGYNEMNSAQLAMQFMDHPPYFTEKDKAVVQEAIMATIPAFDQDLQTVVQPAFSKSSLVAQAVALADLGGAGMEGAETAKFEAIALFVEENMDYAKPNTKRLLSWLNSQIVFIEGRQRSLQRELSSMDERARKPVKELFTHFPDALQGIHELIIQAKKLK